jgi:hypothetical protein
MCSLCSPEWGASLDPNFAHRIVRFETRARDPTHRESCRAELQLHRSSGALDLVPNWI